MARARLVRFAEAGQRNRRAELYEGAQRSIHRMPHDDHVPAAGEEQEGRSSRRSRVLQLRQGGEEAPPPAVSRRRLREQLHGNRAARLRNGGDREHPAGMARTRNVRTGGAGLVVGTVRSGWTGKRLRAVHVEQARTREVTAPVTGVMQQRARLRATVLARLAAKSEGVESQSAEENRGEPGAELRLFRDGSDSAVIVSNRRSRDAADARGRVIRSTYSPIGRPHLASVCCPGGSSSWPR